MRDRSTVCVYVIVVLAMLIAGTAPAAAQQPPQTSAGAVAEPGSPEGYHIEGAAGFWFPSSTLVVSSGGGGALSGIVGTQIDGKTDLGFQDTHFSELHVTFKPVTHAKFFFQYIPISYTASSVLARDVVFNGIRYPVRIPVTSTFDWKAYRFGAEFDFIANDRGYFGLLLEAKYTDVQVQLSSVVATEYARARAPIPAIGGTGRYYIIPSVSITGELSGFTLPSSLIKGDSGHYVDFGIYGTVNFNNNVGVQAGYRSFDVAYVVRPDNSGTFTLKGLYFGIVARY